MDEKSGADGRFLVVKSAVLKLVLQAEAKNINVSKKSFFGDLSVIRTLINRKFKKFTTLFLCSFFPNCPVPPLELPLKKKDAAQ